MSQINFARISNNNGSALPIAIIYTLSASILLSTFIKGVHFQQSFYYKIPKKVQSILTARSGLWFGLYSLNAKKPEPLKKEDLSAMQRSLGYDMFEQPASNARESHLSEPVKLVVDSEVVVANPFKDKNFGLCSLQLMSQGCYLQLISHTVYRKNTAKVMAELGTRLFEKSDTVLYTSASLLQNISRFGIEGRMSGSFFPHTLDSAQEKKEFPSKKVDVKELKNFVETRMKLISPEINLELDNTTELLSVQNDAQLNRIKERCEGSLLIDGSLYAIRWSEDRKVIIKNDLQITGEVYMKDLEFVVGGDIKIFDEARLDNVKLFSAGRIFFGNEKSLSSVEYSGQAAAIKDIEITRDTKIKDQSIIISIGDYKRVLESKNNKPRAIASGKDNTIGGIIKRYSIFIRPHAQVDATVINLSIDYGIKTWPRSEVTGILWAEKDICHQGTLEGVMVTPVKACEGALEGGLTDGRIKKMDFDIAHYFAPYFMGTMSVIHILES